MSSLPMVNFRVPKQRPARPMGVVARQSVTGPPPVTMKDWCERNAAPYWTILPGGIGTAYHPHFGSVGTCESTQVGRPEIGMAALENATVLGGSEAVFTRTGEMIFDLAVAQASRFDFSGMTVGRPGGAAIEEGCLIQSRGAENYFHWIAEQLTLLWTLEGNVPDNVPLLIDARVKGTFREALYSLTKRKVLTLEPGLLYPVGRLWKPGRSTWMPLNLQKGVLFEPADAMMAHEGVAFLREKWRIPKAGTKRYFIVRKAVTAPTRLLNIPEVSTLMESFGFECITPEKMTFAEQRELFGGAAVIAGESGAGLTNIILAPQNAVLVSLQAAAWPANPFANLAGHGGQRTMFLPATDENTENYQLSFIADIDKLRRILKRELANV